MKKIFAVSLISILASHGANAAINWWERPTVCRLDPTDCYTSMGTGYDSEMWDANSECWGMKLICPEALKREEYQPVPMGKTEIAKGTEIKQDFNTDILNGDCFGVRKTTSNGTMASVNGEYVRVWCNGILENPDEFLTNGEITYGAQPTCSDLAEYGYVGVVNNRCYGKYYDQSEYFIECEGDDLLPSRIILLNGADYTAPSGDAPADKSAADKIFDQMESVSETQRQKYFDKD